VVHPVGGPVPGRDEIQVFLDLKGQQALGGRQLLELSGLDHLAAEDDHELARLDRLARDQRASALSVDAATFELGRVIRSRLREHGLHPRRTSPSFASAALC
jgi:hypothetical protein